MSGMRLLVLGGTRFVGWAVVTAALARGWRVTTFNRGQAGADVAGVQVLRGDRNQPDDVARLAGAGPWDAAVDTSGYAPRETLEVCRRLEPVTARYVFMSTVSVYRGWPVEPLTEQSEVLYCPPDAGPEYGEDVEDGPTRYGYQKSGCELAVTQTFGAGRSTVLRPGVVLVPASMWGGCRGGCAGWPRVAGLWPQEAQIGRFSRWMCATWRTSLCAQPGLVFRVRITWRRRSAGRRSGRCSGPVPRPPDRTPGVAARQRDGPR